MATSDSIMDAAERRIRETGYNAFSFRELAADIGIRSASVHYHFPTKGELAEAVARRYTGRFLEHVRKPSLLDVVEVYRRAFRQALAQDGRVCLCGVLAAEAGALPPAVTAAVQDFFDRCVGDLAARIGAGLPPAQARRRALHVMATLEGAMVMARLYGDHRMFDQATAGLGQAAPRTVPAKAAKARTVLRPAPAGG